MNKSLLDTDILSAIGKGIDPTVARHAAAYLSAFGRYTLSAVTVAEVIWGLEKRQSFRRLNAFRASLPSMEVLPFADAADLAGRIGAGLDRIGQPIGLADTMIAAIALEHGLELVTGNTSDFQRVQQLVYPLTLSNWRLPWPGGLARGSLARGSDFHLPGGHWPGGQSLFLVSRRIGQGVSLCSWFLAGD